MAIIIEFAFMQQNLAMIGKYLIINRLQMRRFMSLVLGARTIGLIFLDYVHLISNKLLQLLLSTLLVGTLKVKRVGKKEAFLACQ